MIKPRMISDGLENWWRRDEDFLGGKKILMGNTGNGRYLNEKNTEHYNNLFEFESTDGPHWPDHSTKCILTTNNEVHISVNFMS